MTDTTAPLKPKQQFILSLVDSKTTLAIVGALFGAGGLLSVQWWAAKPVAPEVKTVTVERIVVEKAPPVDLGPLTMKVEEALAELRAAKSAAGVNRRKKTEPLK